MLVSRLRRRERTTRRGMAVLAVSAIAALMLSIVPTAPALAADQSVLDVEITPVDYATGQTQTTAGFDIHGNRVAYRINFSCGVETCTDTTVTVTPPQANPYGIEPSMTYLGAWGPNLLNYETWTAPTGIAGTSIGGDDVTGKVISLGDVPAGFSGSFLVVYNFPRTVNRAIIPAQLYPDGFEIVHTAKITSSNAPVEDEATASPVIWEIDVPNPAIILRNPGTVRPDVDVVYQLRMTSGSVSTGGGNIYGRSDFSAAGNFTVTVDLPPEAVFVSAAGSPAGVYHPVEHTVTWTEGSEEEPTACAGAGWGSTWASTWNHVPPCYTWRYLTLSYPASAFEADENGCNFDATVVPEARVDVTYLDSARTTKTATSPASHAVSCHDPFGRVNASKDSRHDGGSYPPAVRPVDVPPDVTGMTCDSSGFDAWGRACTPGEALAPWGNNNKYWVVYSYNAGNVPGIATVQDDLDLPGMPVYQINTTATTPTPTIDYTYQCGSDTPVSDSEQTTIVTLSSVGASGPDCRFTAATVTSGELAAGNVRPSDTGTGTRFDVYFYYAVAPGTATGERTNTATTTITYPDYPELDGETFAATPSRSVNLRPQPTVNVNPMVSAGFESTPEVDGGGQAVPGRDVTFFVNGVTEKFGGTSDFAPQYYFLAPEGWTIRPGSAMFASGVPAGVGFDYNTEVVDGVSRDLVVASWPDGVTFGENVTLPTMTVVATPTYAVAAGTTSVAEAWLGDSRDAYDDTTMVFANGRQDDADLDGDGSATDWVSTAPQSILVSSADGVTVTKEICLPDPETDGCEWLGDPSQSVPVSTTATGIQYRVTIRNSGNTVLDDIVAYDVLPYIGDTGTSDSAAGTERGSTFSETLAAIEDWTDGLDLTFSTSTNPPRPEVFSGTTTGDWNAPELDAQSIRAEFNGTLDPGEAVFFSYSAQVGPEAVADSIACNSVAVDTDSTVPSEPPAVCALTAEADLEILVPERLPLQAGRPGVLPFTITNHGGSAQAPAVVTVGIPSGATVSSLTPDGWDCTASGTAPLAGPVDLECVPVDAGGQVTTLSLNETVPLDIPVVVDEAATSLCVPGEVSSRMIDPIPANNETEGCVAVAGFDAALTVDKDDSRSVVEIGDEYSYQIEVSSGLVGESLSDVVLTDELPAGLEFVSASDSGALSGANPHGTGGVVTWPSVALGATGTAGEDGDSTTGGTNTSFTRTVTVRVVSTAGGVVDNLARAVATDPADAASSFDVTDSDVDGLRRLTVTKANDAMPAGVRADDTVEYTVTLTNSGTVDYDATAPAVLVDDLSALLDDASFEAGSATIEVGGSTSPVADPVGSLISWSGALPVGESAVLRYSVTVGDGSTGDLMLVNTAYSAGTASDCTDGLDESGLSCATTSTSFAPVIDKRIASVAQNDDGTWTIVYDIDVTSLDPDADSVYDLGDALAYGSGITVVSAAVTTAPPGVTAAPWTGSGPIVADATLPAGEVHSYQLTVVADAAQAAGTVAAECNAGLAGGFANVATLTVEGDNPLSVEACASPVAPTVEKTVAAPVQQPDGTWLVTYTVTVTNSSTAPAGGLAYTLGDSFTIPSGVTVLGVTVNAPAGAPVNDSFDGSGDTALLTGADRVPAASSATVPGTRVYTVAFHTDVPAGTGTASTFSCPPAGAGGYANAVTLFAGTGTTVLDESSACADVAPLPTPEISKRVVQTSVDSVSGDWSLEYEIVVTNPSTEFSTVYNLGDELQFAEDATIVSATMTSTDAAVSGTWDGVSQTAAVGAQSLPAGASDVFRVVVVADPSAVDVESASADCRLDAGEDGTGFRNLATVTSGSASAFAVACEAATDPSVVKTVVSTPTQDASTGIWTIAYEVSVTNRSTTTVAGGIPYEVSDSLELPADVEVVEVAASGFGGTVNTDFDGVSDTALASGSIEAAVDDTTPEIHTFTVTVRFRVPGGLTDGLTCSPTDETGGLLNVAEITVGSRVSGATACADVPDVPLPGVTKSVLSQQQQADGSWLVEYRIEVANPSDDVVVAYDLEDEFAFGDGMTVVGEPVLVSVPASTSTPLNPAWDGTDDTVLIEDVLLAAGGSHGYTVQVVVDSGELTGADAAADCTISGAETATGLTNVATVGTTADSVTAQACATIYDPGVTKTVDGVPVQQADGSWLVSYTMSVTNSSGVTLHYGLEDELDFPAGAVVSVESATARSGGPALVADWDGQTQLQLVAEGAELPSGTVHVFDVTLRAVLAAGQESAAAGFANTAAVTSGMNGAVRTEASAAADLLVPELQIEKSVTADAIARIGSTVSFEVVVRNIGDGDFTSVYPAVAWDDLTGVLDDAALSGAATVTPSTGAVTIDGARLSWRGPLGSGDAVTIDYSVEVTGGGDAQVENVAFAGLPLEQDPPTPTIEECADLTGCASTQTALPAVFIEKSANVDSVVYGDTVEYTVRITNTGQVDLPADDPAALTDDLAGVLDDAGYLGDVTADRGTAEVTGTVLSWSGALDAGQTAVIRYSVRAGDPPAGDSRLENVAIADPTLPMLGLAGGPVAEREVMTTTPVRQIAMTGSEGSVWLFVLAGLLVLLGAGFAGAVHRRRRSMN